MSRHTVTVSRDRLFLHSPTEGGDTVSVLYTRHLADLRLRCLDNTAEKYPVATKAALFSAFQRFLRLSLSRRYEAFCGHVTFLRSVPGKPNIPAVLYLN